jgi:hypothetical protein
MAQKHRARGPLLGLGVGLDQQERAALLQAAVQLAGLSLQRPVMEPQ